LDAEFGFETAELAFQHQGVGAQAASALAKRFRPVQVLTSGGMGKILLAQEISSGRFVALKIMLESVTPSVAHVQQFIREAVITARLQHPYIIPIYDLGFFGGNELYFTMRYVDGESLNKLLPKIDLSERLRILRSAALAVSYVHTLGLWHRDLKPHN